MTEQELYVVGSAIVSEKLEICNPVTVRQVNEIMGEEGLKRLMIEMFTKGYRTAESITYDRELNLKKDLDFQFNKMLTNNKEE